MSRSIYRPISRRLRGILVALNADATEARKCGRDLEADALWRHYYQLAEVYDQALDEEWQRSVAEPGQATTGALEGGAR